MNSRVVKGSSSAVGAEDTNNAEKANPGKSKWEKHTGGGEEQHPARCELAESEVRMLWVWGVKVCAAGFVLQHREVGSVIAEHPRSWLSRARSSIGSRGFTCFECKDGLTKAVRLMYINARAFNLHTDAVRRKVVVWVRREPP